VFKGYQSSSQKNGVIQCYTGCIFKLISRGKFHERFDKELVAAKLFHVRIIKFSIVDISVTVGPSSILSSICDHDVFHIEHGKGGKTSFIFISSFRVHKCAAVHKCAVECANYLSRGQFHERYEAFVQNRHVMIIKFSIGDISVTVGPSSILSLICDHDVFHIQTRT
jgi:hypothetical protein